MGMKLSPDVAAKCEALAEPSPCSERGRFVLTIPDWIPPLLNKSRGRHWSVEAKLKKCTAELLSALAYVQGVPKATSKRRVSILVEMSGRGRTPDKDCWDKILLDSLVTAGLLTGDGAAGLDGRMEVDIVRGKVKATTITLEDVE
jgi:hypothetical protein